MGGSTLFHPQGLLDSCVSRFSSLQRLQAWSISYVPGQSLNQLQLAGEHCITAYPLQPLQESFSLPHVAAPCPSCRITGRVVNRKGCWEWVEPGREACTVWPPGRRLWFPPPVWDSAWRTVLLRSTDPGTLTPEVLYMLGHLHVQFCVAEVEQGRSHFWPALRQ